MISKTCVSILHIYIYIHTHTNINTYIHIYIYIYIQYILVIDISWQITIIHQPEGHHFGNDLPRNLKHHPRRWQASGAMDLPRHVEAQLLGVVHRIQREFASMTGSHVRYCSSYMVSDHICIYT